MFFLSEIVPGMMILAGLKIPFLTSDRNNSSSGCLDFGGYQVLVLGGLNSLLCAWSWSPSVRLPRLSWKKAWRCIRLSNFSQSFWSLSQFMSFGRGQNEGLLRNKLVWSSVSSCDVRLIGLISKGGTLLMNWLPVEWDKFLLRLLRRRRIAL